MPASGCVKEYFRYIPMAPDRLDEALLQLATISGDTRHRVVHFLKRIKDALRTTQLFEHNVHFGGIDDDPRRPFRNFTITIQNLPSRSLLLVNIRDLIRESRRFDDNKLEARLAGILGIAQPLAAIHIRAPIARPAPDRFQYDLTKLAAVANTLGLRLQVADSDRTKIVSVETLIARVKASGSYFSCELCDPANPKLTVHIEAINCYHGRWVPQFEPAYTLDGVVVSGPVKREYDPPTSPAPHWIVSISSHSSSRVFCTLEPERQARMRLLSSGLIHAF